MDLLLSIWEMYESTSTEVTGERNIESGKLPFRKEVGLQFPHGMSLSVFLPTLTKKLLKMLAIAQGLSTVFPLSKILGLYSALTLLMLMIDLIPDQIFFHIVLITQKVILEIIRFACFNIFDNTIPEFLMKIYKIWIWVFTPNDFGIELISVSNFGKNRFSNPGLSR